jgi:hypothetical protein
MNIYAELTTVQQALDNAAVDYALVGGLAVAVGGAPRATKDIDLLVRPDDVVRAKAAVRACGYTPMKTSAGRPLDQHDVIKLTEQDR